MAIAFIRKKRKSHEWRKRLSGILIAAMLLAPASVRGAQLENVGSSVKESSAVSGNNTVSGNMSVSANMLLKATVGTTYYVSSVHGNDQNNGMSQDKPFRTLDKINELTLGPGDQVLLERGSVFDSQYLHLENEGGAEGAPVIIGTYGSGNKPVINTNGTGKWYQDYGKQLDNARHKYRGWVSTAILLYDVEYIEISGLEITNQGGSNRDEENPTGDNLQYNDPNVMNRTGVAGVAQNRGTLEHIVLDDLYIHDVVGNVYDKHMVNGGIYFIMAKPANEGQTGIPRFHDLVIQNCHVANVNRWGIAAAYTGAHSDKFSAAEISDEICMRYGNTDVVIRNNFIDAAGGDSITTMYCYRPLVEHNVSVDAARQINLTDYKSTDFGRVAAAIWPWKCKDALFQYNECYDTLNAGQGNGDGQAWDADSGDGTLYQYNYSSGNTGGAVMFCLQQAVNSTFRYNISQNDLIGVLNVPNNPDAHIYNNTFYMKENVPVIRPDMNTGAGKIENNIFYYSGSSPRNETWRPNNRLTYDNNLYYNYANVPDTDTNPIRVNAGEAVFADPGNAPSAPVANGPGVYDRSVWEGYLLAEGSKAINQGKVIVDDNGFVPEKDFFGRKIGAVPEIGAAESDEVSLLITSRVYTVDTKGIGQQNTIAGLEKNTTVSQLLENLVYDSGVEIAVMDGASKLGEEDIVKPGMAVTLSHGGQTISYTILADNDATLYESIFMVKGNEIYVPSTPNNPCTPGSLMSGITIADTASAAVRKGNQEVISGALEDGMTLRVLAEDGITQENYTIRIKNEYHWTRDYVDEQQGNVWFAQYQDGSSEYVNFTNYSSQYATWEIASNRWDNVGAQGTKGSVTESSHGLIVDFTADDGFYVFMAFRAPMSGKVTFELKADEPFLRQNNTAGSVELGLYLNENLIQSCEMSQMNVQGNFPEAELTVQKGDWIRLRAAAQNNPNSPSIYATPIITYLNEEVEDIEAPSVPSEVEAQDITETSALVTWKASMDNREVTGYELYHQGTRLAGVGGGASQVRLNGLEPDHAYNLELIALDAAGNKSTPASVSFSTKKDVQAPAAPGTPQVSGITENSVIISWGAASDNVGVEGYEIYHGDVLLTQTAGAKTQATLDGLQSGTEYTLRICAVDTAGNRSDYVEISFMTNKQTTGEEEDGNTPGGEDGNTPGGEDGNTPGGEDGNAPGGGEGNSPGEGEGGNTSGPGNNGNTSGEGSGGSSSGGTGGGTDTGTGQNNVSGSLEQSNTWPVTNRQTQSRDSLRNSGTLMSSMERVPVSITKQDEATGIVLEGAMESSWELLVEIKESENIAEPVKTSLDALGERYRAFDITLLLNGKPVQPSDSILVKIPVPEGYNPDLLSVYHIDDEGNHESIAFRLSGEYVEFDADHFSVYAVVENEQVQNAQEQENTSDTAESRETSGETENKELQAPTEQNENGDWLSAAIILIIVVIVLAAAGIVFWKKKKSQ